MNGVRKEWLGSILAQAIDEALQPLRACIEETHARLSVVEAGIKAAARISALKRAVGVSAGDDVTTLGGHT